MRIRAIDIGGCFKVHKNKVKEYANRFNAHLFSFVDAEYFSESLYIILI